ncbi:MAG: hypothetical protein ACRENB_08635 [Gemmatimonadales bacterium]
MPHEARFLTVITLQTADRRTFLVIHEANLADYARTNLSGGPMEARIRTAR